MCCPTAYVLTFLVLLLNKLEIIVLVFEALFAAAEVNTVGNDLF
jgi:hypothetical protein